MDKDKFICLSISRFISVIFLSTSVLAIYFLILKILYPYFSGSNLKHPVVSRK